MPASSAGRPSPVRRRLLLAIMVPLAGLVILAAPRPDPVALRAAHARYVPIGPGLGFSLCADSPLFMRVAKYPDRVLTPKFLYQSRPFLFFAAHGLGRALASFLPERSLALAPNDGWWTPYILIHVAILVAALVSFDASIAVPAGYPLTLVLAPVLLVNEVVRWFFWSPHTQLFNVLAPVLSMAAGRWLLARREPLGAGAALGLGGALGGAILFYGMFLVCPVVLVAAVLVRARRARRLGRAGATPEHGIRTAALVVVGSMVPTALWYLLVFSRVGTVYSAEIAYFRQFVWPLDALRAGRLQVVAQVFTGQFAMAVRQAIWFPLALVGLAAVLVRVAGERVGDVVRRRADEAIALALTVAVTAVFLYGIGLYRVRLEWCLVPPVLGFVNLLGAGAWPSLRRSARRTTTIGLACLVAGYVASVLVQDPPP